MGKIIALLTDFGSKDGYSAVMKGVINKISPNSKIIDLTHDIQPQNVNEAAFVLWASYQYFPKQTIFVTVVDPGVGSERKILLVKSRDYIFLAPDNNVLKYILSYQRILKIYSVENKKYFLSNISNTFHGRDIFAPVAAYLSKGVLPKKFGKEIIPLTKPENFISLSEFKHKLINGKIIYIDRFGNVITNIFVKNFEDINKIKYVLVGEYRIDRFLKFYSQSDNSNLFGLVGSTNLLELSARNMNASEILKVKIGANIKVVMK